MFFGISGMTASGSTVIVATLDGSGAHIDDIGFVFMRLNRFQCPNALIVSEIQSCTARHLS